MLEDLRKTIEATIGELTPARAKSLAKSLAGPGAAKDQVSKSATDLIEWSQKNRDKIKEFVRREVSSQVGSIGVAAQSDLEALKKRVRALERQAAASAAGAARGKTKAAPKTTARSTSKATANAGAKPGDAGSRKRSTATLAKGSGANRARS